jgi:hypothetical protein
MTRRMTLMVLALVGLMVLVVTVSPPDRPRRGAETPTPPPASSSKPLSDPNAFDVSAKLTTKAGAKLKTVEAVLGDRVQITVDGSEPDSVALGELRTEQVEQGLPARFEMLAETPGTYPLVLLNDERQIGTLKIR